MNNIIAISKCDDTTKLQARLAQLSSANINGLSDRITQDEDTSKYLFNMFKGVKYSDDGLKSVGVLEIFPHLFYGIKDEDGVEISPPLLSIINADEEIIKVLAFDTKANQADIWDNLTPDAIASIREVHKETYTYKDEDGNDVTVNQSIVFWWLA